MRWLQSLGATQISQTKHGTLFYRTCPQCGKRCRILVPREKNPLTPGTLGSICRSAHVTKRGAAKCPSIQPEHS